MAIILIANVLILRLSFNMCVDDSCNFLKLRICGTSSGIILPSQYIVIGASASAGFNSVVREVLKFPLSGISKGKRLITR